MGATVTVGELLEGHVGLDSECLDRIYLNGYVPSLQVAGQVVSFMTEHLGLKVPSPAVMEKIGTRFRRSVDTFARANQIPLVKFTRGDRKIEMMRRYLDAQAGTRRSGVAAIGYAQEFQNVYASAQRDRTNGVPWFSFYKADRRVTCFYFYIWDEDFGPAFIKICAYFPYPVKVWVLWRGLHKTHYADSRIMTAWCGSLRSAGRLVVLARDNQSPLRNASSASGGRYRPGVVCGGAVRASARSLIDMSACT